MHKYLFVAAPVMFVAGFALPVLAQDAGAPVAPGVADHGAQRAAHFQEMKAKMAEHQEVVDKKIDERRAERDAHRKKCEQAEQAAKSPEEMKKIHEDCRKEAEAMHEKFKADREAHMKDMQARRAEWQAKKAEMKANVGAMTGQ
jgi:hypothetical protein